MNRIVSPTPKIIPGSKAQTVACARCTYLNNPDAKSCGMCEAELTPPTHDVQPNGMWKCGSCSNLNRKGAKECSTCKTPFYSSVTSSAPAQIFCSQCSFLNDGDNAQCVQCDNQLRSTLEKISSDLRDSTNFLARDMGVNINVKCPGCMIVCFVPPATAGLRCGTCHTYFASPTVGEVTNFHMSRLASSITSSFRGFFSTRNASTASDADAEVPVGRLIAIGEVAQRKERASSSVDAAADISEASFMLDDIEEEKPEEILVTAEARIPQSAGVVAGAGPPVPAHPTQSPPPAPSAAVAPTVYEKLHPISSSLKTPARLPIAVPATLSSTSHMIDPHSADPQDMYKVEGDIVEL